MHASYLESGTKLVESANGILKDNQTQDQVEFDPASHLDKAEYEIKTSEKNSQQINDSYSEFEQQPAESYHSEQRQSTENTPAVANHHKS